MDIELFLKGVLKGAQATRCRHQHQAKAIQAAIHELRGKSTNPHDWQVSDLRWFLESYLADRSLHTRYWYWLTVRQIVRALGKMRNWLPLLKGPWRRPRELKPRSHFPPGWSARRP